MNSTLRNASFISNDSGTQRQPILGVTSAVTRWLLLVALALAAGGVSLATRADTSVPQMPTEININTADAKAIANVLKGVGLSRATAIVAYRERHGAFTELDQLGAVKGIGERTLKANAERIRLQD
jgi:competence protein ComEA